MSSEIQQVADAVDTAMAGGALVDVAALALEHTPVAPDQDGGDSPTTGSVAFGSIGGTDFGVWEMSVGTMYDVEAEEIFVVTAGAGTVLIAPFKGAEQQHVELFPGSLMRLSAGMQTTWTVRETLRKVYISPTQEDEGKN